MTGNWRIFALLGLVATATYLLDVSSVLNGLCMALVGVGTVAACFAGPRHFRAEPRRSWRLMGVANLLFLVGVLVRPLVSDLPMPMPLLADAATVPAYLLLCAFLGGLLRNRQSIERHAVLDGLIVCVAGTLATTLLLGAPAANLPDRPLLQSVLAGIYPLLDAIVLLLLVNLTFTARGRPFALVALIGAVMLLFVGDLAYAIIGITGQLYAAPILDAPYLVAFTLLGTGALHPSVVELGRAARLPVQAWSVRRMAVLLPALATPYALLVLLGTPGTGARVLIAVCGAVSVALLVTRAIVAVRAQAEAQSRAEHQARHDPLTGLPNRRSIVGDVERMLTGQEPVWVLLIGLDRFKHVNDTWGHATGDRVVVEVGRRLRERLPAGVAVAAMGGDEFLLAYAGSEAEVMRLPDAVRESLVGVLDLPVSASVGIARAEGGAAAPAEVAQTLLRDADTAMYRAKESGPGGVTVFDESMHDQVRERTELELALRLALAGGQLHVAYQPIVRLETGLPIGAEALLRWTHPERGPISPGLFVPIAEDAGLITEIGTWVRREALRKLAEWRADGVVADDFYLSVNVSPHQLGDPELPLIVSAELLEFGLPAATVALEVTESAMVDATSTAGRVVFELRELGLKILIDDFGTGFSALGYLRRFPATGLKIDRSFVTGMGADAQDDAIVKAVVAMSAAVGLSVVAEGVETRTQRDALIAAGVRQAQGWLWGPAVPPTEFATSWHVSRSAGLTGY